MSHYPSTAELASFRRAIVENDEPAHETGTRCPVMDPDCEPFAVFPDELRNGIGYSGGSPTAPFLMHEADGGPFPMGTEVTSAWADAYDHSWARKAAGAMRSRAFGFAYCDCCGEPPFACPGCYSASPYVCGEALTYGERCYHVPFVEHSHSDYAASYIR